MVVFLTLNICRKLRISVISSSQWNMSLVSISLSYLKKSNAHLWSIWFLGVIQKYELCISFKRCQIFPWKLLLRKSDKLKTLKSVSRSIVRELQPTQISLNFHTCCNLKNRGLGQKLCVAFLLFLFWKELWCFTVKQCMLFVEQKYKD